MIYFSAIINLSANLAKLARTLFTDAIHFMALLARSRAALAAENLFLRKQLAFYQERDRVELNSDPWDQRGRSKGSVTKLNHSRSKGSVTKLNHSHLSPTPLDL